MPSLCSERRHLPCSKVVHYMNILENIVQSKKQTMPCLQEKKETLELFPSTTTLFPTFFLIQLYIIIFSSLVTLVNTLYLSYFTSNR